MKKRSIFTKLTDPYNHMHQDKPRSEAQIEFNKITVTLLQHKYRYYKLNHNVISDSQYDKLEADWNALGVALGYDMENYGPWIDFPEKHWYVQLFPGKSILEIG